MPAEPPSGPKSDPGSDPPDPAAIRVTAARCARCGQPVLARYRPFCSQRCAEIDLGQWASGSYRIASPEQPANAAADENAS